MRWVLVSALAWLAAMGLFAAAVQVSARAPRVSPHATGVSQLAQALSRLEPRHRWRPGPPEWVVTRAVSALHLMVADVEANHPEHARAIAETIISGARARYDEVLIYVRGVGGAGTVHRVQWTARGGLVEWTYPGR
ncbi:MAG: hypothetical protein Q7J25_00440 [Vicinamibacterales bacterium]|nr:hypothetical protein [Vicinamibacterales bacterium]